MKFPTKIKGQTNSIFYPIVIIFKVSGVYSLFCVNKFFYNASNIEGKSFY